MGGFGDIIGGFTKMVTAVDERKNAKNARKNAQEDRANYYGDVASRQDAAAKAKWTPTYESSLIGPYQRTQSPEARAYLASMLTGDNVDQASAPWDDQSAQAQRRFNSAYGTEKALRAQGREERSSTPWDTKTPGAVDTSAFDELIEDREDGRSNVYGKNRY